MLSHTQEQFFVLLRAGLWDIPVDTQELGNNIDWKAIYIIAKEQTVIGLIADAIGTLPADQRPPMPILQKIITDKLAIEKSHARLNNTLNAITEMLNMEDIPSVLLKGQGVAQNYPHPTSRTCGDIDLYIGQENYEKACEMLLGLPNTEDGGESEHHWHLDINGITVEIHRKADMMVNFCVDKKFQEWTKSQLDAHFINKSSKESIDYFNTWNNNGQIINRAPAIFDAVFIMTHMLRHMFYEGVGLRQLCDWTMHIHQNHNKIDVRELSKILKDLNLEMVWNTFAATAIHYLALPVTDLPLYHPTKSTTAEHVINIMFETGNFGKYSKERTAIEERPKNYFSYKCKRFNYHFSYYLRVMPIFPKLMMLFILKWLKSGTENFFKGIKK